MLVSYFDFSAFLIHWLKLHAKFEGVDPIVEDNNVIMPQTDFISQCPNIDFQSTLIYGFLPRV